MTSISLTKLGIIFGIVIIGLGLVGWFSGIIFSQTYYYETGHTVLFALGQLAVIVGPVIIFVGVILFAVSMFYDISRKRELVQPSEPPSPKYQEPSFPTKVKREPYCRQCGSQIDQDSAFCKHCGAPVTDKPHVVKQV
jgi:uncharacterized membrane protein